MIRTAAILFFALVFSAWAEDFNWSWEKTGGTISEKPDAKPPVTEQKAAPVMAVPDPVSASTPEPAVKPAAASSAGAAPASDENFFWAWEKDATKPGGGKNRKTTAGGAVSEPGTRGPSPVTNLPAEIENLSGAVPKSSVQPEPVNLGQPPAPVPVPRRPNPPSSPVALPSTEPAPAPAAVVKQPETILPAKVEAGDITTPVNRNSKISSGIDSKAYDELIKENLDLHKKVADARQDKDVIRMENQRLAREVADLEQKIADSVVKIKTLGKQKADSSVGPDQLKVLEDRVKKAEQEKVQLSSQLASLQKKALEQGRSQPAKPVEKVVGKPVEPVQAGSDLYKKLESENLVLRQKLAEIDAERQKALKARDETEKKEKLASEESRRAVESQKQMKEKLEEARSVEKKNKRIMVDLAERIPDMEKEMTALQKKLSEKDASLKEKERNLEVLANEVQQRENRIRKAEKMVELMEQAQKDVSQVSDSEKRDMHYNMAAVYSQVGRFRDAEREYLHALRLDPTDADVHYNLGILYDESLNDKQRAALHYRRYLKLRPNGPDVDSVKNWLMTIDMK